jgi:hypothetical protein
LLLAKDKANQLVSPAIIYRRTESPANILASLPIGQWNAYEIEANGNDIKRRRHETEF